MNLLNNEPVWEAVRHFQDYEMQFIATRFYDEREMHTFIGNGLVACQYLAGHNENDLIKNAHVVLRFF